MRTCFAICEQQRQSAHPRSLISAFVIRCLDSIIIPIVSIPAISSLSIASVATQTGLSLPWSQIPEDRFSRDEAHIVSRLCSSNQNIKLLA